MNPAIEALRERLARQQADYAQSMARYRQLAAMGKVNPDWVSQYDRALQEEIRNSQQLLKSLLGDANTVD